VQNSHTADTSNLHNGHCIAADVCSCVDKDGRHANMMSLLALSSPVPLLKPNYASGQQILLNFPCLAYNNPDH